MQPPLREPLPYDVVLFDGVCNLCHMSVQFIIDRDRAGRYKFVSLQSERGAELTRAHGGTVPLGEPESILLIREGRLYSHSGAALRIARHLDGAWSVLWVFLVVPTFIRDAVYRWVARHRYRWFGKEESCRMPTPDLRARFLDEEQQGG